MAVSWNESWEVVELVLWSMLSTAAVVNNLLRSLDRHTTASLSYRAMTLLAMSVEIDSTQLRWTHDGFPLIPCYDTVSYVDRNRQYSVVRDTHPQFKEDIH